MYGDGRVFAYANAVANFATEFFGEFMQCYRIGLYAQLRHRKVHCLLRNVFSMSFLSNLRVTSKVAQAGITDISILKAPFNA